MKTITSLFSDNFIDKYTSGKMKSYMKGGKMKKQILLTIPLLVLLTASVFALAVSLRASGGEINYLGYLGSDNSDLIAKKVSFSSWSKDNQGKATLEVIAENNEGKRIVFNLNIDQSSVIFSNAYGLYIEGTGTGTYWEKGSLPKKVNIESTRYYLNKVTNKISILGEGDIYFKVTGMQIA